MKENNSFDDFAIAGAGLYGEVDKEDIQTRLDWVKDRLDTFIGYAKEPLTNTDWAKADKPFCFLAWQSYLFVFYEEVEPSTCFQTVKTRGTLEIKPDPSLEAARVVLEAISPVTGLNMIFDAILQHRMEDLVSIVS